MPAPSQGRFSVEVIAKLLMLEPRRIQQLVAEGYIPKPAERGQYSLVGCVQGYIRYLKEHSKETNRGSQQQRLASAQAQKVEMENFRRMGELVTRVHADETTSGLIVMMKTGTEGLPGRLANELAGLDPPRIYQVLQREFRNVLDQCADYLEKRADSLEAMPEPGTTAPASAATATDEMGGEESGNASG